MHPLRLLLDILPLVLVEQRRVPRPRRPLAVLPLARRFPRRAQGREERDAGQQHEFVPVPHDPELLEDVSKGVESRQGDRGDQENDGFYLSGVWGLGDGGVMRGWLKRERCFIARARIQGDKCNRPSVGGDKNDWFMKNPYAYKKSPRTDEERGKQGSSKRSIRREKRKAPHIPISLTCTNHYAPGRYGPDSSRQVSALQCPTIRLG